MKALILAAGLGTRLRPVTDKIPKALVEYNGKTLLEHSLDHLKNHGISEVVINLHHFGEQIKAFMERHHSFGFKTHYSDESSQLLETGGAVLKASSYLTGAGPFIVRNVDIISNLDLGSLVAHHASAGALATLAVRARQTSRYLLFNDRMRLVGWENTSTAERILIGNDLVYKRLAFSGIQVISSDIFQHIRFTGRFSLIDLYLDLAPDHFISGFEDHLSHWMDAGKMLPANLPNH
jgi:NDP-sugar pyrophosphorylase family protein